MMSITRSTACPPICRPKLPPSMAKKAGALHPLGVRQLATPRPYRAPKTNPPFSMEGTTATHSAEPSTSWGMPVSGALWISSRTAAADRTRSTDLLSPVLSAATAARERQTTTHRARSFFIISSAYALKLSLGKPGPDFNGFEQAGGGLDWGRRQKNAGLAVVTLDLHSQPRLPGSVVGEASMRQGSKGDKITTVTGRW